MTERTFTPRKRRLKHGDAIPIGEPSRAKRRDGYVTLLWRVGQNIYVEALEHRVVMGLPPSGIDVHHVNGAKDDNRPENLQLIAQREHSSTHNSPVWDVDEAANLYREGMGFAKLGKRYGVRATTLYRALMRRGIQARPQPASLRQRLAEREL